MHLHLHHTTLLFLLPVINKCLPAFSSCPRHVTFPRWSHQTCQAWVCAVWSSAWCPSASRWVWGWWSGQKMSDWAVEKPHWKVSFLLRVQPAGMSTLPLYVHCSPAPPVMLRLWLRAIEHPRRLLGAGTMSEGCLAGLQGWAVSCRGMTSCFWQIIAQLPW